MNLLIRSACVLVALLWDAPAPAADPKGAGGGELRPLMTRKGKQIFSDDFAGPGIDPKWVRPKGNWSIADGVLKGGERKADQYSGSSKASFDFADAVLEFDLKFDGAGKCGFAIDSAKGHVGRLTIAPHGFTVQKDGSTTDPADPRRVLDTAAFEFEPGEWYTIMVELSGGEILVRLDDRHFVLGADPKFQRDKTRIAFGVHGEYIHVDNVKAFDATPNPDWPAVKAKLQAGHAPPPRPPVIGPDHYRNAQSQKKRKAQVPDAGLGIFQGHEDVGAVLHAGSVDHDAAKRSYTIAGGGENMWATKDAFHFAWKKTSGDLALAADVAFLGRGKDPHRKACLMIRQDLSADSAYVDVALHGDGLTSLQFRQAKGAATHEVQANLSTPRRLHIEKRGKYATMFLAAEGGEPSFSGAAVRIALKEPFYVGLGVCAHDADATERAVFSNVELTAPPPELPAKPVVFSVLETQTISSTDRRVVHVTPARIEAPNWLRDGRTLIYNSGGRIVRIPAAGGEPQPIDTGFATRCNNDHGVSPDGTRLVISDGSQGERRSLIYTLPIAGGTPKLVTPTGPSYWHGWSPDGKTLAYCAERGGKFDIYTIPAEGGPESRLTTAEGLDDGPEYSPDGEHIYFNSDRAGRMQIWRMRADGSGQEAVVADDENNWFPHPSPDGRRIVFLSFEKDVTGHPANKDVTLRMMTLDTGKIEILGEFFGGQGTINVPCWSPDGRRIAFVSYQAIP